MPLELPKSQKKIARELIEKSLQIECDRFIEKTEVLIGKGKQEGKSPHEIYVELYKKIHVFDKHIAHRYDDLKGSTYFFILLGLIHDKILSPEDINRFDENVRNELLNATKLWDSDSE